jgi:hypothetical protein
MRDKEATMPFTKHMFTAKPVPKPSSSKSSLGHRVTHPPVTDPTDGLTLNQAISALGFSTTDAGHIHKHIMQNGLKVFTGDSVLCWHWVHLQHIRRGACVAVAEYFLDWLNDYDQATLSNWACSTKSLPNPARLGVLDAYIAWTSKPDLKPVA